MRAVLVLSLVLGLCLDPDLVLAQTGQVPATGAGTTPAPAPKDPGQELLDSPDAILVAKLKCAATDTRCPVAQHAQALEEHFDDTFKDGTGNDTALVTALKGLLGSRFGDEPVWDSRADWAVIHLMRGGNGEEKPRFRWLLASRGVRGINISAARRIYGAKNVAFIFVHLNQTFVDSPMQTYGDLEYRAIVKAKLAVNVEHLLNIFRLAGLAEAKVATTTALLGYGVLTDADVPSDITAFGLRTKPDPITIGESAKYDNEGRAVWDVSVGVPANKLSLLEYSTDDSTYLPKKINKQSIYAMVNLYPVPVDLKSGSRRWVVPRFVFGFGMTGRPGDTFLIGGAWGIPQLQFFVGSGFAATRVLQPGKDPQNGASYIQKYSSRLTYGINVPVFTAIKKVAK